METFVVLSGLFSLGYYIREHLIHIEEKINTLSYFLNEAEEGRNMIKELPRKPATKRKR